MDEQARESRRRVFQLAAEFCFPRLSGSKGEREAQETALKILQRLGLKPLTDEFQASYLIINFFSRMALVPLGLFLIIAAAFYRVNLAITALIFFLVAAVFGLGFALVCQSPPGFPGGLNKFWSRNIYAQIGPENPEREIVVAAHYDSKSQTFPIWFRILTYYIAGLYSVIAIALGIYGGTALLVAKNFHPSLFWSVITAAVIDFLPLLNRPSNRSPGAVDNASGVAAALELAREIKDNPLKKSRVWILLTGAEELGLFGARDFARKHSAELDPKKTLVINLDSLGTDYKLCALSRLGFPGKKTDRELNSLVKKIAEENSLPFRMVRASIGFSTDAAPFMAQGYRAVSLGFINRWVHTSSDTIEKLIPANLGDYVRVLEKTILRLDQ